MRHAQRHWLKVQAEKAVERALKSPDKTVEYEVIRLARTVDSQISGVEPVVTLHKHRDFALMDAARYLEKAEILHREILRRGGSV